AGPCPHSAPNGYSSLRGAIRPSFFVEAQLDFHCNRIHPEQIHMNIAQSLTKRRIGIVILAAVFVSAIVLTASGQQNGRDMDKEQAIWRQIQSVAPKAVDDFKAGTTALDNSNYQEAARLYQRVYKQAPGVDAVNRRLGISLVLIGQIDQGMPLLETALKLKRSPENLYSLAQYLAFPSDTQEGDRAAKERALPLVKEANQLAGGRDIAYTVLTAQVALSLDKMDDYRAATRILISDFPDMMASHYYDAILLAMDDNWPAAEVEIKKAGSMGLSPDVVRNFLAAGAQRRAVASEGESNVWRYAYYAGVPTTVWAIGLLALFIVGKVYSKIAMRVVDSDGDNAAAGQKQLSFRKSYR